MHATRRPPFPSEEEFDRIATRYFVVPSVLWGVALLAIVQSASLTNAAEPTADATRSEPATVAYGA
jgi:ABC-type sulfate transport system permease component